MSWAAEATLRIEHEKKGQVVVGRFGFVWQDAATVYVAPFRKSTNRLMRAFVTFADFGAVVQYEKRFMHATDIVRFVRTGALPPERKSG